MRTIFIKPSFSFLSLSFVFFRSFSVYLLFFSFLPSFISLICCLPFFPALKRSIFASLHPFFFAPFFFHCFTSRSFKRPFKHFLFFLFNFFRQSFLCLFSFPFSIFSLFYIFFFLFSLFFFLFDPSLCFSFFSSSHAFSLSSHSFVPMRMLFLIVSFRSQNVIHYRTAALLYNASSHPGIH